MDRIIVFGVGIISSILSEIFWKGGSRWHVGLWGGLSMLLLRRIVLRFSGTSRALLCLFGALLLITLRFALVILQCLGNRAGEKLTVDMPSFSYALYRFLLIAPAYTIIEYVEASFCM